MINMKISFFTILLFYTIYLSGQTFSSLKIDLTTQGATVYLDKVQIKGNNLSNRLTVASGNHTISATREGYYPYQNSFSLGKGEHLDILINLEKDTRSSITISSKSGSTKLKIDGEDQVWNSATSLNKLIKTGYHEFNFSEYGKIDATINLMIIENSLYNINIDLQSSYPEISPSDIGQSFKQPVSLQESFKPTTKVEKTRNKKLEPVFGFVGLLVVGTLFTSASDDNSAMYGGMIIGALLGVAITPKIKSTVSDYDAIKYNQNLTDELVRKNEDIKKYNDKIRQLVLEREKQLYVNNAIRVEGPLSIK